MIPFLPLKLILTHFLSDFVLQSRWMATNKSSKLNALGLHLAIIFLAFLPTLGWEMSLVNAVVHGIIDWNLWKLYKLCVKMRIAATDGDHPLFDFNNNKEWAYWEDYWFYVTIGFDQFLHIGTLLVLINFVK